MTPEQAIEQLRNVRTVPVMKGGMQSMKEARARALEAGIPAAIVRDSCEPGG